MKKENIILVILLAVLGAAAALKYGTEARRLKGEVNRLSVELAQAQIPLQRDTIRDSIEVVTQTVVEVAPKSLTDALAADQQLIKDLQLKVKQLESLQTTVIETGDTVAAQHEPQDSLFYYSDQWADLKLSLKDTTFYYNIRDSLSTAVYREPVFFFSASLPGLRFLHRFFCLFPATSCHLVAMLQGALSADGRHRSEAGIAMRALFCAVASGCLCPLLPHSSFSCS